MSEILKLEDCVFERDENGDLIPREIDLIKPWKDKIFKVRVVPLSRGARKKLASEGFDSKGDTSKDTDRDLVLKYCKSPQFSEDDIDLTEFGLIELISLTILKASGLPIGENKNPQQANKEVEDDFQEGSPESEENEKKES